MSSSDENINHRCWTPGVATTKIRDKAIDKNLDLFLTLHAKKRMQVRDIIMGDILSVLRGDILSVLRNGFVYSDPEKATRNDHYKYQMEGTTPNSNGRVVKVVVIPGEKNCLKIVTVMWRDEQ